MEEIAETNEKISRINTDQQKLSAEVKRLSLRLGENPAIDDVNKYVFSCIWAKGVEKKESTKESVFIASFVLFPNAGQNQK